MQRSMAWVVGFSAVLFLGCSDDPTGTSPPPGDDAGTVVDEDAGAVEDAPPSPALCHSGGAACSDGVACCGDQKCEFGYCKPADGTQCRGFGADCSASKCCQGKTCTKFAFGSRCTIATTCTKEGSPCADSGNCCGGLTCRGGVCAPPLREAGCKVIGETCGTTQTCCPSTPYCESMKCCIPSDWANVSCGKNADCCSGSCKGGICLVSGLGGSCTFDADCGQKYDSPVTAPRCGVTGTCCVPQNGTCSSPSDCCSGSCTNGTCGCLPKGTTTNDVGSCCSKLAVNKVCA